MPFSCPHCSKEIAGAVSQDTLTERINAKETVIKELRGEVAALAPLREVEKERDAARAELAEIKLAGEREAAFTSVGVTDPKVRERLGRLYAAETRGVENAPAFADWLGSEDTRAVFGHHYSAKEPAGAKQPQPQPQPQPKGITGTTQPGTSSGAAPAQGAAPKPPGAETPAQLRERLRRETAGMQPKERLAKLAQLQNAGRG